MRYVIEGYAKVKINNIGKFYSIFRLGDVFQESYQVSGPCPAWRESMLVASNSD
jgi:hypothetical protein